MMTVLIVVYIYFDSFTTSVGNLCERAIFDIDFLATASQQCKRKDQSTQGLSNDVCVEQLPAPERQE